MTRAPRVLQVPPVAPRDHRVTRGLAVLRVLTAPTEQPDQPVLGVPRALTVLPDLPVLPALPVLRARLVQPARPVPRVQPVLPEALPGFPFAPVSFQGFTINPYVNQAGRIAYSLKASGIVGPKGQARPAAAKDAA